MSKNLLNPFNIVFPFNDFLYVLQVEEYDNKRYIARLPRFFLRRNIATRDTLKYTSRIQTTFLLTIGLYLLSLIAVLYIPLFLIISPFLIPLHIWFANNLLTPFYEFMKLRLQKRAAKVIKKNTNLKIIAIAGSYGKTTTKNFLYELVRYNYKTQMVPGNINTPTGIAAWSLKELQPQTEILLVEMDTYFVGEIKRSCMITTPDISIITSIGDQHVERFGTQQKMAMGILEVFRFTKPNAKRYILASEFKKIKDFHIDTDMKVIQVKQPSVRLKTNITSQSAYQDLVLAYVVAQDLHIPEKIIKDTIKNLVHPDRRQKKTEVNGYTLIDDSYNISATTAREGVIAAKNVAHKLHKKLLVVTAGIPELGPKEKQGNTHYRQFLEKETDQAIILQSIFKNDLNNNTFEKASNIEEVWKIINKNYPASKYVILMQPELTDLYY